MGRKKMVPSASYTKLTVFISLLLLLHVSLCNSLLCREEEMTALLVLKSNFTNNNSTVINSWIPNTDCCQWTGVDCDPSTGHVTEVDLGDKQVFGQLPSNLNSSALPMLSRMFLYMNKISGIIPIWIFKLPSLTFLFLSENLFTGFSESLTFPVFSPLENLLVDHNNLQGPLPKPILEIKSLQMLDLEENNLTGTISFTQLCRLRHLDYLRLSNNKFSLVDDTHKSSAAQVASSWPQFTYLGLSSCNLGEFPSFLRGQSSLNVLKLSNNNLQGEVPEWVLNMAGDNLTVLDLSYNALTGTLRHLPWPNLFTIDLRSNLFEGPIPSLPQSTSYLWTSKNQFSGMIPSSVCQFASASLLDLSYNNLTGNLPTCLVNIVRGRLLYLDLRHNQFGGILSPMIFEVCGDLTTLNLNSNHFEGNIPKTIARCSNLQMLHLGNNHFHDTFLYWLDTLPYLQFLILGLNNIYDSLLTGSNATSSYSNLRILDLSNNHITGGLSSSFLTRLTAVINVTRINHNRPWPPYMDSADMGDTFYNDSILTIVKGTQQFLERIFDTLVLIDLSSNQLQGPIPNVIGELVSLNLLNLSHNHFTGQIPSSLSNLSQLESLDLSVNHLIGRIPDDLIKLGFLEFFNVSYNKLVGPVPSVQQFSSFEDESYLGNPRLCGPYLTNKCEKSYNSSLRVSSSSTYNKEDDSSSFPSDLQVVLLGCTCGTIFGLVVGYILFVKRTPFWLLKFIVRLEHYFKLHNN